MLKTNCFYLFAYIIGKNPYYFRIQISLGCQGSRLQLKMPAGQRVFGSMVKILLFRKWG